MYIMWYSEHKCRINYALFSSGPFVMNSEDQIRQALSDIETARMALRNQKLGSRMFIESD